MKLNLFVTFSSTYLNYVDRKAKTNTAKQTNQNISVPKQWQNQTNTRPNANAQPENRNHKTFWPML